MTRSYRRAAVVGIVIAAIAAMLLPTMRRPFRGLTLVARAAASDPILRTLADLTAVAVDERVLVVPIAHVATRARAYVPASRPQQTVLLVSGLHPAGIDEPRLIQFSRALAASNILVVTPEIPELSRFEITPRVTDRIEAASLWLAVESGFAPDGRIGLMGVSFSGGLAVVAAGRPALRGRLRYVFSFGGHDDLQNVLDYFCGDAGSEPSEEAASCDEESARTRPHDYGVAIALLAVAADVVPPQQLTAFEDAVRRFLWASYLERIDKRRAAREFDALRALAPTMPEPSATLIRYVNDRDVVRLGPWIRPNVGRYAGSPALSPARSALPRVPVFLLHGRDDTVIPATESDRLAGRLRGHTSVRRLVTDLVSHADADQPADIGDVLRLAAFWGDLLSQ